MMELTLLLKKEEYIYEEHVSENEYTNIDESRNKHMTVTLASHDEISQRIERKRNHCRYWDLNRD